MRAKRRRWGAGYRSCYGPDVFASFGRRLVWLGFLGLVVRLSWVALEPPTYPVADETMWLTWGVETLPSPEVAFSPLKLRFIFHAPLYLYFLGALHAGFGALGAVKAAQALLGASLATALALLGRRFSGETAGLLAGAMAALYPELVWFVSHFWAETLFTVLLWWAMERLAAADAASSSRTTVLAGVLFGLAILTRETVLYFVPFAAVWLAWHRPGGLRRAVLFGTAALGVVAPWTLRNHLAFGGLVPVSTAGGLNLWQGNALMGRQEVYDEYWAVHGRIQQYEFARRKGIDAVLARQPLWIFEKLRDEMPAFWAAHGQPIVHLERGAYDDVPRSRAWLAIGVVLAPYLGALVLFVAGIAFLPRSRLSFLLLGFLVYYVMLHVATHGYPRYRLPALPVLFLVGAHGVAAWSTRPRPALGRRGVVAAVLVAFVLALSVGPSLIGWARDPWPPPWFASPAEGAASGPEGR